MPSLCKSTPSDDIIINIVVQHSLIMDSVIVASSDMKEIVHEVYFTFFGLEFRWHMYPLQESTVSPEVPGGDESDPRDPYDDHDREYRKAMHLCFSFFTGKMHGGTNAVANCQRKLEICGGIQKAKSGCCECQSAKQAVFL